VRGNSKLNRDIIIKTVADAVGPEHPVNLKNYDLMILVDVAQVSTKITLSYGVFN
jgi:tRNA acetyltransferase TAN1